MKLLDFITPNSIRNSVKRIGTSSYNNKMFIHSLKSRKSKIRTKLFNEIPDSDSIEGTIQRIISQFIFFFSKMNTFLSVVVYF